MVKSYLRYEHARTFGIVASATSNSLWTAPSATGTRTSAGHAVVPANEEVLTWDIKTGTLLSRWRPDPSPSASPSASSAVSCITHSITDPDVFAVGYSDGTIRLWDRKTSTPLITFSGHRSAVSALAFDHTGARLASGGKDAHIVVWDLLAEVGVHRLRGHKDAITALEFIQGASDVLERNEDGWLLSTGKDTLIKLWDLSTQHCTETHVAHAGECWAMSVAPDQRGCVTAGNDGEIKVWGIDTSALSMSAGKGEDVLVERGALYRQNTDRAVGISFHPGGAGYIAAHGGDKSVEIFRIRSAEEVKKALKRRRKRREAKDTKDTKDAPDDAPATVTDVFVPHLTLRTSGKVRSTSWALRGSKSLQLLVACSNNTLEFYDLPPAPTSTSTSTPSPPEYTRLHTLDLPGHRTDVRALALSSDTTLLASASSGALKIWNLRTGTCVRTFECGYALCCSFLPGDGVVVVGTKEGRVEMFDVASAGVLEGVLAHDGAVWAMQVHPGGKELVTGSADRCVKFWEFRVVHEEIPGTKRTTPRLTLSHTRTLKLTDDILSLRVSPNGLLLSLSLLDNTVRVFLTSSLKHLLTLHGHKLPVLAIDIDSTSTLIATCSADKNVKIWGLDFGDCHKSFFAHSDSVMSVCFARGSKCLFSASKDGVVKYWDAEKFELISEMRGHMGEVWALAVGGTGDILVSASHDKSIRVWEETSDEIFLSEEREKALEALHDQTLTTTLTTLTTTTTTTTTTLLPTTTTTLTASERLFSAIDIAYPDHTAQPPPNPRHPVLAALNISASQHVLTTTARIPAAHLPDTLHLLPFDRALHLLVFLEHWAATGANIPLTCRVLFVLLRVHQRELVGAAAGGGVRGLLERVRKALREKLRERVGEMGVNLAAVRYVAGAVRERGMVGFEDVVEEGGGRKRAFATVA